MPDWLMGWLGQLQGGVMGSLAAELRAGGIGTAALAFALGALHALTPGHGKSALAAYFLGREARIGKGLRVALTASLLHVVAGLLVFLVLHLALGQLASISGRPSYGFSLAGNLLIAIAGIVMLVQSIRSGQADNAQRPHGDSAHALTAGIGLLPCPLTISVLGFTWVQSSAFMIALALVSLALGIALTIGLVAVLAILARMALGAALADRLPAIERGGLILQGLAGAAIATIGLLAAISVLRL